MRNRSFLPGIILIIVGLFFFIQKIDLPYMNQVEKFFTWQMILIGIGLIFIWGAVRQGKHSGSIFPGIILLGLGIHFFGQEWYSWWPSHWAIYTFIVSIAFFGHYLLSREKGVLIPAFVLLGVSLFTTVWRTYLLQVQGVLQNVQQWWPVVLILVGIFIIFRPSGKKR